MVVSIRRKLDEAVIDQQERAESLFPPQAYNEKDHLFLCDDQTIGFGFDCQVLCGCDSNTQERINALINMNFPPNTILQVCNFRSPDIVAQLYAMQSIRDKYNHKILDSVVAERVKYLNRCTEEKLIANLPSGGSLDLGLFQDTKLIISVKIPINKINNPTDAEIEKAKDLANKVKSSLKTAQLAPRILSAQMYVRIMQTMLNWGPDASWRHHYTTWDKHAPLSEQILDYGTDFEVEKNGIRIGNQYVKLLSAKKVPEAMYFGDAIAYAGDMEGANNALKENYMVVTNIFFPEAEKTKNALETKRTATVNQARGPLLTFVPILADKKRDFDILYESFKNGARPVRISYSLVIFGKSKEEVNAAATAATSYWRESQFEMMEDKFVSLPLLINCLPLCTDLKAVKDLWRYKTMSATQAAVLIPIFGEWKGTGQFYCSLISRNGQLMSLSLHDASTNKNFVIAAESGAGKSFLTNDIILAYMSEGAQVWVIDAGKSYKKLCKTFYQDSEFIEFSEETDICLNPFEHIENYDDEEDALVTMVGTMASAKGLLTELQTSGLKSIMTKLWSEHGKSMKIDMIEEACLKSDDPRIRDIGTQLFAFTSKGSYGKYFARKNNVKFTKQLTVLELDELQGRKHLRQVVLLQLIYQIQQEVFLGERNRKKILIIDEAWDLLKEGEVATFMEHAYRKFRKYDSSVGICTQSINDLYQNAVGQAIAENSANMYLLGQKEDTIESVKNEKRLALSDGNFKLLKTVHTEPMAYSEIFVKTSNGIGIGRLIVSPFQQLLYSTRPEDTAAIEAYTKIGKSVPEAMNQVLIDRNERLQ